MDEQKDSASVDEVAICDCMFCTLDRVLKGEPEPTSEQIRKNMLESIRRLMAQHKVSFEELRVLVTEFANSRDRRQKARDGAWPWDYSPTGRAPAQQPMQQYPYDAPLKTPGGNPFKYYQNMPRSAEQQEFDRKSRLALELFSRLPPEERAEVMRKFTEELKRTGYDY